METKIKITNHVLGDKGIVSRTENVSSIIDKMIRLTAKLTEHYASDIYYDIKAIVDVVENGKELDRLLFFRECGVTTRETRGFDAEVLDSLLFNFTPIQIWRLTHDPKTMETKLIRVDIRKEMSIV